MEVYVYMTNLGEKIRLARERAGLTQNQVTERCGIDDSSLSSFENGHSEPRLSQLEQLSGVYHIPLSFFFDNSSLKNQIVMWRNKPEDSSLVSQKEIEAEFLQLCQQYRQLEIWTNELSEKEIPILDNYGVELKYALVQEMANNARKCLGLGDRPGNSLYTILEEVFCVKIFHLNLGSAGVAACAVSDDFGKGILLNSQCSRWRRNHDLAHELFHILTWERFNHDDEICNPSDEEEKFATCFAGNLLLPEEIVKISIEKAADSKGQISFDRLDNIAREFDVSLESLLWRMHFVFNWKEEETKKYIEEAKEFVKNFPRTDSSQPQQFPERYKSLAIKALQEGKISQGRFTKFMKISRKEAEKYISGRETDYAEVPIPAA